MKWSILILTMRERKLMLDRLLDCLAPQVEKFPLIEVMVRTDNRKQSVAQQRQDMMEKAVGEYINFIDDDDMVAQNYVESIYPLLDGVDYIGFPVKVFRDGNPYSVSYHSLKHRDWKGFEYVSFRDISHLNPIKRELALKAKFEGGYGEDHRWALQLRNLRIVKTEHYIPEQMYFYYMRTKKCEFSSPESLDSLAAI